MSIIAKIKGAKKAADKHKQETKAVENAPQLDKPKPYRHVPTHAAVDALSGAPSTWTEQDRTAIKAAHSRRQSLIRNSSNLSGLSTSSTGSNPLTRNSSFVGSIASVTEHPTRPSAEARLSHPGAAALDYNGFNAGYNAAAYNASFHANQNHRMSRRSLKQTPKSPLSSAAITPTESSATSSAASSASSASCRSSASSQVLELPSIKRELLQPPANNYEHGHKSTTPKAGDAPTKLPNQASKPPVVPTVQPTLPLERPRKSWSFGGRRRLSSDAAVSPTSQGPAIPAVVTAH